MKLMAGSVAPDFQLPADDGTIFHLYGFRKPVLLVFYPGDASPVCAAQLCDYRDRQEIFVGPEIHVLGISRDGVDSHQRFKDKHEIPFPLLTDRDGNVAADYGVKTLLGTINRALFLIAADGKVLWAFRETVSVFRRSSEEVKTVIEELKANGLL